MTYRVFRRSRLLRAYGGGCASQTLASRTNEKRDRELGEGSMTDSIAHPVMLCASDADGPILGRQRYKLRLVRLAYSLPS